MKKRKIRVVGDWKLYIVTNFGLARLPEYYLVGERNGEKFWFYHRPKLKEVERLMENIDPDRVLRVAFPSRLRRFPRP